MGKHILVASRKGLFVLEKAGNSWAIAHSNFIGDPVTMILYDPRDSRIYAAVGHGHFGAKLHASGDGGKSFEEISAPKYPEKPADYIDIDPMRKIPIPWNVEQIWSLAAGGANERGTLWCGTIPGGLFHSKDGGNSWKLMESLWLHPKRKEWMGGGYDYAGIHSICVDPRNEKRVLVGVSCGGAWLTEDGGESWTCRAQGMYAAFLPPEKKYDMYIQDPHCIAQCKAHPDIYWAQHHNAVFRSDDGALLWKDLPNAKPSNFGFAVAAHPHDAQTAWFVPAAADACRVPVDAKLVVSRTRDGGESFEVLSEGLCSGPSYDLIYRHALDVDDSGNCLVMGSTTGGLWISEDQGDSWTALNIRLPPVYCVRWC